ncbi:MAG: hypothetical protein HPM95_05225 [Alphaproteobacteria bacterium]|nr:hypothetical protein [Alphaproteobacteria bacterium]
MLSIGEATFVEAAAALTRRFQTAHRHQSSGGSICNAGERTPADAELR